jgi:hypothetical protein
MFEMKGLTKEKLSRILEQTITMSDHEIYLNFGDKYQIKEVDIDCKEGKNLGCLARCCYFFFGLSPQDVKEGIVKWDEKFPFMIKQREDKSCVHLNRNNLTCEIWKNRPAVCREYSCQNDKRIGIFKDKS